MEVTPSGATSIQDSSGGAGLRTPVPLPDLAAFENRDWMEKKRKAPSTTNKPCPSPPPKSPAFSRVGFYHRTTLFTPHAKSITTSRKVDRTLMTPEVMNQQQNQLLNPLQSQESPFFDLEFPEQERIGVGSFSEVFKVRSRSNGNRYAVKRARKPFSGVNDRDRALQEVHIIAELGVHPHCVSFVQAWEQKGILFIQTELCEGGNLSDLMQVNGKLQESQLWNFLVDLLLGLDHIHTQNLTHLDIKPSNIFITFAKPQQPSHSRQLSQQTTSSPFQPFTSSSDHHYQQRTQPPLSPHLLQRPASPHELMTIPSITAEPLSDGGIANNNYRNKEERNQDIVLKIGDFGLARKNGTWRDGEDGDPCYLATELLSGDPRSVGPWADIFSLGATLFEMAANCVMPPRGPLWQSLREGHIPSVADRSEELQILIAQMMDPDPSKRPTASFLLTNNDRIKSIVVERLEHQFYGEHTLTIAKQISQLNVRCPTFGAAELTEAQEDKEQNGIHGTTPDLSRSSTAPEQEEEEEEEEEDDDDALFKTPYEPHRMLTPRRGRSYTADGLLELSPNRPRRLLVMDAEFCCNNTDGEGGGPSESACPTLDMDEGGSGSSSPFFSFEEEKDRERQRIRQEREIIGMSLCADGAKSPSSRGRSSSSSSLFPQSKSPSLHRTRSQLRRESLQLLRGTSATEPSNEMELENRFPSSPTTPSRRRSEQFNTPPSCQLPTTSSSPALGRSSRRLVPKLIFNQGSSQRRLSHDEEEEEEEKEEERKEEEEVEEKEVENERKRQHWLLSSPLTGDNNKIFDSPFGSQGDKGIGPRHVASIGRRTRRRRSASICHTTSPRPASHPNSPSWEQQLQQQQQNPYRNGSQHQRHCTSREEHTSPSLRRALDFGFGSCSDDEDIAHDTTSSQPHSLFSSRTPNPSSHSPFSTPYSARQRSSSGNTSSCSLSTASFPKPTKSSPSSRRHSSSDVPPPLLLFPSACSSSSSGSSSPNISPRNLLNVFNSMTADTDDDDVSGNPFSSVG